MTTREKIEEQAARLAMTADPSNAHMDYQERFAGIRQMLLDLNALARNDGCIAAAWALERLTPADALAALGTGEDTDAESLAWIRAKLGLPADAQMFRGKDTIAGALHVWDSRQHGYTAYIEAHKCDDKQGEIARLTKEIADLKQQASPPAPAAMEEGTLPITEEWLRSIGFQDDSTLSDDFLSIGTWEGGSTQLRAHLNDREYVIAQDRDRIDVKLQTRADVLNLLATLGITAPARDEVGK